VPEVYRLWQLMPVRHAARIDLLVRRNRQPQITSCKRSNCRLSGPLQWIVQRNWPSSPNGHTRPANQSGPSTAFPKASGRNSDRNPASAGGAEYGLRKD
jgi:hypothetical protein